MASEITLQGRLQIAKNGIVALGAKSVTRDLSGSYYASAVQNVGTAAEAVEFGDLTNIRYAYFYNGSAATVTVTTTAVVLKPGDVCVFPPAGTGITLQSTAAATPIDKVLTEA